MTERAIDQRLIERVVMACERSRQAVAAYVYGSAVREDFVLGTSDIDVLVILADAAMFGDHRALAAQLTAGSHQIDVTLLRQQEVEAGLHPGWSDHFFANVAASGWHVWGADVLAGRRWTPRFDQANRRLVQLTQRTRLVVVNPGKSDEANFWLAKYQHWIPLCLMELLDLAGQPETRLRRAHSAFDAAFRTEPWVDVAYPYPSLDELQPYLEHLIRWVQEHRSTFGSERASGVVGVPR